MINICSFSEFDREFSSKRIILIGAGKNASKIVSSFNWNIVFAIDNDPRKQGTSIISGDKHIDIFSWNYLLENTSDDDVIVITPGRGYQELIDSLEEDKKLSQLQVVVFAFMQALQWDQDRIDQSTKRFEITKGNTKIEKTIHYFWFSGDEFPDKVKRCIDSWHRYCPDYSFVKWDLLNYNTDNLFCNEALSVRQWAFASDFARCDVLYRYGGIYLDTDVELIKPLDELLCDEGFFCFESADGVDPGSGMASIRNNKIMGEIREQYYKEKFIKNDGQYNRLSIISTYTDVLKEHGLTANGIYQKVDNIAVYPALVMSPYSYMTGIDSRYEKTYGVHHWVSAWISEDDRKELEYRKKMISENYKGQLLRV